MERYIGLDGRGEGGEAGEGIEALEGEGWSGTVAEEALEAGAVVTLVPPARHIQGPSLPLARTSTTPWGVCDKLCEFRYTKPGNGLAHRSRENRGTTRLPAQRPGSTPYPVGLVRQVL